MLKRSLSTIISHPAPASSTKLIDASFSEPLIRISLRVSRCLDELRDLRQDSTPWTNAFEALSLISASPRRHLFRPQLVLLGAQQQDQPLNSFSEAFAAGVELQHLFMLVHDDIMDKGTIRRGLPTISVALSRGGLVRRDIVDHLATLIGDVVHAKSLGLLTEGAQGKTQSVMRIVQAACRAGAAQFDDVVGWQGVERELRAGVTLSMIQARHAHDIAVEHGFVAPLISGLLLCDKPPEDKVVKLCQEWGEKAGTSFLELDDVSDIVVHASESGKDSLQDIREGRLSQMLFALRRLASQEEWESVSALCGGGGEGYPMTLFDRRSTLDILSRHRVASRTVESALVHMDEAEQCLEHLPSKLRTGLSVFSKGLRKEAERMEALAKGK